MALASYADLVIEIGNWLNRSDLGGEIPTLIRLFEARLNRRLRAPDQEITANQSIISGNNQYPILSPIRQVKTVLVDNGVVDWTIAGTTVVIDPIPTTQITLSIIGYATITPLDGVTTTSNWVLSAHPDLYLYGTLTEAAVYLRDDEHLPLWRAATDDVLEEVLRETNQRKVPSGPIQTRPAVWE